MKKLLLSLIILAFCCSSYAQIIDLQDRWYNQFSHIDYKFNNILSNNEYTVPIWEDSSVLQKVDTGYIPIHYSSYYQVIDPINSKLFNDGSIWAPTITKFDAYQIDSIAIFARYVRIPHQPKNQVDTLICSIAPISGRYNNARIALNKTQQPNISWYTAKDSIFAYRPYLVDSNNLAAYGDTNAVATKRVLLKILLTAQDGDTITNGILPPIKHFIIGPTKPLAIAAGDIFAVTVSFKSGGTWVKNVTPIDSLHRFMPAVSYHRPDTAMPYYYETHDDRTTNGFMLANSYTYTPSLFLEANSSPSFREEFISISALTACYCTSSIHEIGNNESLTAYPNPAKDVVTFKYKGNSSAKKMSLTIVNSMGIKVVELPITSQTTWQTSHMPSGLYFYQLRDNNQILATGKLSLIK